jgi:hypothetical protein
MASQRLLRLPQRQFWMTSWKLHELSLYNYIEGIISESINDEYKDGSKLILSYNTKTTLPDGPDGPGSYLLRTATGMYFGARLTDKL